MRLSHILIGAIGAGALGYAALERSNDARQGSHPTTETVQAAWLSDADQAKENGEADCPNLTSLAELRDVERDENGRIIATAFVNEPTAPASAPTETLPVS